MKDKKYNEKDLPVKTTEAVRQDVENKMNQIRILNNKDYYNLKQEINSDDSSDQENNKFESMKRIKILEKFFKQKNSEADLINLNLEK